jgi:hypothetical protein
MRSKHSRALRPIIDRLDDRCLLSGFSPQQLQTAYGLQNLKFNNGGYVFPANGMGETIAIIDVYHDPYLYSDMATFDANYGISTPGPLGQNAPGTPWFYQANYAGGHTDDGWAQEETLDVEAAHAMAPGANILVIEAASDNLQDLLNAIQTARTTAGVAVVSMSFGISEFAGENAYDAYFTTPAGHAGITFIASSGDTPGPEWPAVSPYVLSVGGTTLYTNSTGAYAGESAWASSGGGFSQYEPEPVYQYRVQISGLRSVPDVAFDGDPNTGINVYTTTPSTRSGSWSVFGGTSVGAPYWSGIMAVIDEGYALAHIVGSLDSYTQTLPILYSRPSSVFNVVTPVTYTAGFGRHRTTVTTSPLTSTGLGSPNGTAFINLMLGYQMPAYNGSSPINVRGGIQVNAVSLASSTPGIHSDVLARAIVPAFTTLVLPLGPGQGAAPAGQVLSSTVASEAPLGKSGSLINATAAGSMPTLMSTSMRSLISPSKLNVSTTSRSIPSPTPAWQIDSRGPADLVGSSESPLGLALGRTLTTGRPATITCPDSTTPLILQNAPRVFDPTDLDRL